MSVRPAPQCPPTLPTAPTSGFTQERHACCARRLPQLQGICSAGHYLQQGSAHSASASALQVSFDAPCRTTKYPRKIPELPWYRQALPQMLMAGETPSNDTQELG